MDKFNFIYRYLQLFLLSLIVSSCITTSGYLDSKVLVEKENNINQDVKREDVAGIDEDLELKKAIAFEKDNQHQKALEVYENLYKLHPESQNLILKLGDSNRFLGRCHDAKEFYSKLLVDESISGNQDGKIYLHILEGIGMCMIQDGSYTDAIDTLSSIFEIDACRWRTINALGVAYALSGNNAESKKYFEIAISLDENQYIIYNNMALASAFAHKYDEAIKYQKQAVSLISPTNQNIQKIEMNLALLFGMSGRKKEAEEILEKYLPEEKVITNMKYYEYLNKNSVASKQLVKKSLGAINSYK